MAALTGLVSLECSNGSVLLRTPKPTFAASMVSLTKDLRLVDAELQSLPAPQSQKKIRVKQLNMLYSVTLLFRSETNGKVVQIRTKLATWLLGLTRMSSAWSPPTWC